MMLLFFIKKILLLRSHYYNINAEPKS